MSPIGLIRSPGSSWQNMLIGKCKGIRHVAFGSVNIQSCQRSLRSSHHASILPDGAMRRAYREWGFCIEHVDITLAARDEVHSS
jgi:hypothetical protein